MISLRSYQDRGVALVREHWRERPILMLPTGAGKTVCAASMILGAAQRGRRALFLVHRRELVRQAVARLADWGVHAGVVAAGWNEDPDAVAQVASIQTLARRGRYPEAGLVIVDECQHARASTWARVLDHYASAGACVVGLSATPYRLDGRGLAPLFGYVARPVTVQALCDEGVLVEPRVFAPPGPDLTGVRKRGGDFEIEALAERMQSLEGDVVRHWLRHAGPARGSGGEGLPLARAMRTVLFAVNIAHSLALVERFRAAGVRAEHVDGSLSGPERDARLHALESGAVDLVSNCMVLGEGWDLPALECAVLARPTASMALHRQQVGRIMRAAAGKDEALVLDHAGNTVRLGRVTDEVEVALTGKAKVVRALGVKICPSCFRALPSGCATCPECGHVFGAREETELPEETEGRLVELERRDHARTYYTSLIAKASRWGSRIGWARHQFKERHGYWPSDARGLGRAAAEVEATYVCRGYEARSRQYGGVVCGRCFKREDEHRKDEVGLSW